jgi:general secretion pathway protein M
MNARALPSRLAVWRQQAQARWRSFAPRERLALALGGGLLGLLLAWSLLIGPAWRAVRAAPVELDRLDTQLQQMQRLASEARSVQGAAPVSAAQAVEPLKRATERLGGRGAIAFQGERATLTLTGVSGEALRAWLVEARAGARARPVEVQLNRGTEGYSGVVVMSVGVPS